MSTSIRKQSFLRNPTVPRVMVMLMLLPVVYPIVFIILTALKSTQEFYVNVWSLPRTVQWSNFYQAWTVANIGSYFINSAFVVGSTVIIILVLGAMAGYALARLNVPYSNVIVFGLLFTTMLPTESVLMPLYMMMSRLRLLGNYMSLIIPYVGWWLPITIYIYKNFFESVPEELLEAARIDGCTEATAFFRITIPLMLPAIATCAILNFVNAWGELLWASVVLSTSQLRTIPLGIISFQTQFSTDWGPLSAAICVVLLPLVFFFLFTQRYFIDGLSAGGVKG